MTTTNECDEAVWDYAQNLPDAERCQDCGEPRKDLADVSGLMVGECCIKRYKRGMTELKPERAVDAAIAYLMKHRALEREAPKVIGRDVPVCPPLEEPLWDHHKAQYGFVLPDRLVRWAWVA